MRMKVKQSHLLVLNILCFHLPGTLIIVYDLWFLPEDENVNYLIEGLLIEDMIQWINKNGGYRINSEANVILI